MLQRSEHSLSRHRRTTREAVPNVAFSQAPVRAGDWLWLCRQGAEHDVCEELALYRVQGEAIQPALVRSSAQPKQDVLLTFVRQGIPVAAVLPPDANAIAAVALLRIKRPVVVHVFAPDSDPGNMLSARADALKTVLIEALRKSGAEVLSDGESAVQAGGQIVQACFLASDQVAVGVIPAIKAQSLFPGGRQRFRKPKDAPSRSARKLEEALAWCGHTPASGEVCVDLGAAPGGWSQVLVDRRCHVVAIDPGRLAPEIARRVEHLRMNAFSFAPEIPADWVVCDMAYRPLEVAALLARWGRHRWAQFLIANFKLPMKKRVEMVGRIREILATGGWTGLKMRQLYHDREEVTVFAWRGFGVDTRVPTRESKDASPDQKAPATESASKKAGPRRAGFEPAKPVARRSTDGVAKPVAKRSSGGGAKPVAKRSSGGGAKRSSDGSSKPVGKRSSGGSSKPVGKRSSGGSSKPVEKRSSDGAAQPARRSSTRSDSSRSSGSSGRSDVRGGRGGGKPKGHVRRS
ncbi:MAG: 23S rRNA (cytidine(2498)-2'-O)-methyltransferase RlmM [Myxococcales bacterium]|nr:23S rRNA (cytidine(2498)-2'-O)-methyltransferase RlmM [Myxococcales bacterium]